MFPTYILSSVIVNGKIKTRMCNPITSATPLSLSSQQPKTKMPVRDREKKMKLKPHRCITFTTDQATKLPSKSSPLLWNFSNTILKVGWRVGGQKQAPTPHNNTWHFSLLQWARTIKGLLCPHSRWMQLPLPMAVTIVLLTANSSPDRASVCGSQVVCV